MNFALAVVFIFSFGFAADGRPATDLIIINGNVRTLDSKQPRVQAIAIAGERITAVGSNKTIRAMAIQGTRIVDANGKLVIPGFNDAHVHFTAIGNRFSHLDLSGATSADDVIDRIAHFTNFLPKGRWIIGAKLDQGRWQSAALPTLAGIDAVSSHNPVFLYFADPKSAYVNSLALKMGGFALTSRVASNGEIVRDTSGRATGVVTQSALNRIRSLVPIDFASNWAEIAETASNYAASLGVTSVQDVHSDDLYAIFNELDRNGRLKTRVYDCIGLDFWEKSPRAGLRSASGSSMVRRGCVKWLADSRSEDNLELRRSVADADKAGLQVLIHAIGERENGFALDAFEYALGKNGARDRRFRIEHAQRMHRSDIARLSKSQAIPSMQPFLFNWEVSLGGEDFRAMRQAGTTVAFGSDAPMTDLNPLFGIHAAVNSGDSITVEAAVYSYTLGSAFAEFQENEKGSIRAGKLADLVILSDDIFTIEPGKIRNVKVLTTVVGGKVVF